MATNIHDLPPEMLRHIFSYLKKEDLVTTIPHVCQYWNDLSTDPTLYQHFHFSNTNPDTSTALTLIDRATRLLTFRMTNRSDTDELLLHLIQNGTHLERLEIHHCRGSPDNLEVSTFGLRYIIKHCSNLQYLSLKGTLCTSKQFYEEIGLKLPLLKGIHFGSAGYRFSSDALLNIVASCRGVEEFRVDFITDYLDTLSSTTVRTFCDAFRESLRIAKFKRFTAWTDESLSAVTKCRHLRELHLTNARQVTDDGIMSIADMPVLVDLELRNARLVTSPGWIRLLENPSLLRLEKLYISGENINDNALKTVKCLKNLTDLVVYRTHGYITNVSMIAISTLKKLDYLCLHELPHVTDEGIMALADLPHLECLELYDWHQITTRGWIEFFRMPNTKKITHLWFKSCENLNDEVAKVVADNLRDLIELQLIQCEKISNAGRSYVRSKIPTDCRVTF